MTTKLNNSTEIKNAFDQLLGQLTEEEILENESTLLMYRFLDIVDAKRKELGWSRKDLAEKIGATPSYISQLFQGDKLINMNTLAKLQKAMGIRFEITTKGTASLTTEFLYKTKESLPKAFSSVNEEILLKG